jgi:hypothetical protein
MGTDKTKDSDFDPNNAMENWAQSHEFTVAAKARVAVDAGLVAQQ